MIGDLSCIRWYAQAQGIGYFLVKQNELEANVEEHPLKDAPTFLADKSRAQPITIDLSRLEEECAAGPTSSAGLLPKMFSFRNPMSLEA